MSKISTALSEAERTAALEKQFKRRLSKAGWYAYQDVETRRMVTNAYTHEVEAVSKICGLPCVVVRGPAFDGGLAHIGPKLEAEE